MPINDMDNLSNLSDSYVAQVAEREGEGPENPVRSDIRELPSSDALERLSYR